MRKYIKAGISLYIELINHITDRVYLREHVLMHMLQ